MRLIWSISLTASLGLVGCSKEARIFTPGRGQSPDASAGLRDAATRDNDDAAAEAGALIDGSTPPALTRGLGVGLDHTCSVEDGALICWGKNEHGQLGVGDVQQHALPLRVGTEANWVEACGGEEHTCALHNDGRTECWGKNLHGELGLGDFNTRSVPTSLGAVRFVHLACGGYTTCGIEASGRLLCWGENFEGKLGLDDPFDGPDVNVPVAVSGNLSFRDVSVGQGHVCGVTGDGELYCWGRNTEGQCGTEPGTPQLRRPTRVGSDSEYKHVASGQEHNCATTVDGRLLCWGTDSEGSLGLGVASATRKDAPLRVGSASDWAEVRVQWFHSCARSETGALYCWGRNAEGQLGLGDITPRNVPTRVGSASDWVELGVGRFHSCGMRASGVYCWGINDAWHQLGVMDDLRRDKPALVSLP